ncbi:MAG TPA: DUF924 family protein [Caldimonas sp.]|nr:DUF924 family protein [Caldimonas sp.]
MPHRSEQQGEALPAEARSVLHFWFGAPGSEAAGTLRPEWWRKDAGFDAEIRGRFGPLIERALRGEVAHWGRGAHGALAQVLLLDQFTRNAFRGTPRAFAGDPRALEAAEAMVARGHDEALPPEQRAFAYMPFEHAESMVAQERAVELFARLAAISPVHADQLDYARRHRAVVVRFGRFPHRNAILGRESTPEETAFLLEPGSSF